MFNEHKIGDLVGGFCDGQLVLGFINGCKGGNIRAYSIDWFNDDSVEYMYSLGDIQGFKEILNNYVIAEREYKLSYI